ncbi:MAG TPA: hypothetical protein VHX44_13545, partial [Planctomycetota bacterium]|nr:hypothetical protein [Planctomycetota bacterium]
MSNATALRHADGLGWHGRVPLAAGDDRLLRLATTAAGRAWNAIAKQSEDLAIGVSTSKGDPALWERALAGEPGLLIAALPGQLTPLMARALRCGPYQPAPV